MSTPYPPAGRFPTSPTPWVPPAAPALDPRDVRAAGLYAGEDDSLVVVTYNSVAGLVLEVRLRTVMLDGRIVPQTITVTPTAARARSVVLLDISSSFILGAAVVIVSGAARRGQCFVTVSLGRGPAAAPIALHTLISDYVVTDAAPAWPGAHIRQSTEGTGALRSVLGTNPAAGVEISETVPAGARWRLRAFRAALVTSAAVANRRVHVFVDDGTTKLFDLAAADVQAASLTRNYNAGPDLFQRAAQDTEIYIPLGADALLLQGWRIRTVTTALDVADDWGAPQLLVEEWIEA